MPTPYLEPWLYTLPHGLGCPCFAFGRLCHVRGLPPCWGVEMHGCCPGCWPLLVNADARPCPAPCHLHFTVPGGRSSLCCGAMLPPPFSYQLRGAHRLLPAGSSPLTPGACWPPADRCARPSAADCNSPSRPRAALMPLALECAARLAAPAFECIWCLCSAQTVSRWLAEDLMLV